MDIDKNIVSRLIAQLINPEHVYAQDNVDNIAKVIINNMDEHAQECILHLMLADKKYKPVKIGDYVMFEPASYHAGSEYERDILIDMGLDAGDGKVYGKVTGHNHWGIGDFILFLVELRLMLFIIMKRKNLKKYQWMCIH